MTTQDRNKKTIAALVHGLAADHDPTAWRHACAPDFRHHFDVPGIALAVDGVERLAGQILAALPDLSATVDLLLAEGDLVVERATATGTHIGSFLGEEPTNRTLDWAETHVYRLADGQVAEFWPGVRLGRLRAEMTASGEAFVRPPVTAIDHLAAVAMGGASRLLRPPRESEGATTDRNRALVRRYVEEFKNAQRFSVFPRLFAPGFRHHFGFPGLGDGLASFVAVGRMFLSAFPDVRVEVRHLIADGDYVVEHNRARGTHRGTIAGIPATGRRVEWDEAHIYRIERGEIAENWPAVDFERILSQLRP